MNPKLIKVRQSFDAERIEDVKRIIRKELSQSGVEIAKGVRIAIAVGSRGIANLPVIVRCVGEWVRKQGGEPFIVPAMGSHGGATAEGQEVILASLGVTEEEVGISVVSSMEVVELERGVLDCRIFMDKLAFEADGVILINRIKPHTDFHGPYESGLAKMTVIGLGKHDGALEMHGLGVRGLRDLAPRVAREILSTGKILLGLAVVENAYDETCVVKALRPESVLEEEPRLLDHAKKNMPRLPVDEIDVLLVDGMGKNISGTGMDPNIIGRMRVPGHEEPKSPRIKSIVVADLTDATHGNALGLGLADVITRKLFDKVDWVATYENVFTTTFLERGKVPIVAQNLPKAFAIALRACGPVPPGKERIVRIRDTLHLREVYVSRAVFDEGPESLRPVGGFCDLFDEQGELSPF